MEREREWGRYEEWERGIEGQNQHTKRKMHIMPEPLTVIVHYQHFSLTWFHSHHQGSWLKGQRPNESLNLLLQNIIISYWNVYCDLCTHTLPRREGNCHCCCIVICRSCKGIESTCTYVGSSTLYWQCFERNR